MALGGRRRDGMGWKREGCEGTEGERKAKDGQRREEKERKRKDGGRSGDGRKRKETVL